MSASKIKKLVKEYYKYYEDEQYASFMISKSKGKKKNDFQQDADFAESLCTDVANQIMKLSPSKYMLNKYPELQDILETI